jgi:hypothetical protein
VYGQVALMPPSHQPLLALTDDVDVDPYTDQTRFNEEALLNYELGLRYAAADGRLSTALALFSMHRDDQQVKGLACHTSD